MNESSHPDSSESARRPPRLRLSLFSFLLLTAVVALSITTAMLWREVGPLRSENRRLREEVGELVVRDASKPHAIRVRTENELVWKWRMWIPQGSTYRLRSYGDGDPGSKGFPGSGGGTIWLRDGGEEIVVTYRILRDPRDGVWNGQTEAPGSIVGGDEQRWVEWRSRSSRTDGVSFETQEFEPDKKILLIRHRVSQSPSAPASAAEKVPSEPSGFVIWLEPK